MRVRRVVLMLGVLASAAYAGSSLWTLTRPTPAQALAPVPSAQQLQAFQAKADQACLCVRRKGHDAHEACWADYKRSVAPFKPSSMGTACAFEANYWDFFAPDEHGVGDMSVTLQRAHGACTEEEERARIAEAAKQESCG